MRPASAGLTPHQRQSVLISVISVEVLFVACCAVPPYLCVGFGFVVVAPRCITKKVVAGYRRLRDNLLATLGNHEARKQYHPPCRHRSQ
jgi:hypothetical protein